MSFQAYLDTIKAKTGLGPDDFKRLAAERDLAGPGVKASQIIDWLGADYGLGRGHAMAIVAVLKDARPAAPTTAHRRAPDSTSDSNSTPASPRRAFSRPVPGTRW